MLFVLCVASFSACQTDSQDQLIPYARYSVPDTDPNTRRKYKLVSFDEFRSLHPTLKPSRGVVEVFGAQLSIGWPQQAGPLKIWELRDVYCKPMYLQRSNASTLFAAAELCCPEILSEEAIATLSCQLKVMCFTEVPDNIASAKRKQRKTAQLLSKFPNVLYFPDGCSVHQITRGIECANPYEVIGDVHAVSYVLTIVNHSNSLLRSWKQLSDSMAIEHHSRHSHVNSSLDLGIVFGL